MKKAAALLILSISIAFFACAGDSLTLSQLIGIAMCISGIALTIIGFKKLDTVMKKIKEKQAQA